MRAAAVLTLFAVAMQAGAELRAQAAQAPHPKVLELGRKIDRPLLSLPAARGGEGGADIRYYVEEAPKGDILWLANKGKEPVHFGIIWTTGGGAPLEETEDGQAPPPVRLHIAPMGRMCLAPPKGFKGAELTEIRVGQDYGPFVGDEGGGDDEGGDGGRKAVRVELQRGPK